MWQDSEEARSDPPAVWPSSAPPPPPTAPVRLASRRIDAPLLEREHELATLEAAIASARGGAGRVTVLQGSAGLGKTSLLEAAADAARADGLTVLCAQGRQLEAALPFGGVLQLFEDLYRRIDKRRQLVVGAARLAAPLLGGAVPSQPPAANGLLTLCHGLYWLTVNIADDRPTLLLIDDVQWCDGPTATFLAYLARRLEGLPASLVLTVRSGEPLDSPAATLLAAADHPRTLTPLTPEGVDMLLRRHAAGADPQFSAALVAATGGNPLLVRTVLQELEARGLTPDADSAGLLADLSSDGVSRSVAARLGGLPAAAPRVARAAAVLGPHATVTAVAHVAQIGHDEARGAATALCRAEILTGAGRLAFVHPLVEAAVIGEVTDVERAALHRRAAEALTMEHAPVLHVAEHLLQADGRQEPWAVDALRRAAAQVLGEGLPDVAARYLRRALREGVSPELRVDVLCALGRAELKAGERGAELRFAAALEAEQRSSARARLLLELGEANYLNGQLRHAVAAFDRGLALVDPDDRELRARLEAGWLTVSRLEPDLRSEAIGRLARVEALAARPALTLGERVLLGHLAGQLVFAAAPRARAIELARLALGAGDLLGEETSDGLNWIVALGCLGWADDFDGYERGMVAALRDARRRGSVLGFATASYGRSFVTYHSGRLAEAVADAQQAIDAEAQGWGHFLPAAHAQLAWALIDQGDLEGADRVLTTARGRVEWRATASFGLIEEATARLCLARGRPRQALARARSAGEVAAAADVPNPSVLPWRGRAALAADALGLHDEARRLVGDELALARRFGAPRAIGVALRVAGMVEGGAPGLDLLQEAVEVLADSPAQLEHARALVELGACLRRSGRLVLAREPLRRGLASASTFGAVPLARRARDELVAAGSRPRRVALTGAAALTAGERRVVDMAAEGLSNPEIAQALFVTRKTVEVHLSHAYKKLRVRSRADLRRALARPLA